MNNLLNNLYSKKIEKDYSIKLLLDLNALCNNYKKLKKIIGDTICATVLKADAYGLGCDEISTSLYKCGCRHFFVSHNEEGIKLRKNIGDDSKIYVLNPNISSGIDIFINNKLIPTLNYIDQIKNWKKLCNISGTNFPCIIHVDTGMNRSGISYYDFSNSLSYINELNIEIVMTHLFMDDVFNEITFNQINRFMNVANYFPNSLKSLCSSNYVIKNKNELFMDMVRIGIGIYGVGDDSFQCVPSLWAKIYEIMEIKKGDCIGYEATYIAKNDMKIATILIGYADGVPIGLSNNGYVDISGYKAPIIGRISMDLMTVDITNIPEKICNVG